MSEWLAGFHAVVECLRARRRDLHELWVLEGVKSPEIREATALAESAGVPVHRKDRQSIARSTETGSHQGLALKAGGYPYADPDDLLGDVGPRTVWTALDHIQDPHNLGAILRSACFFGLDGVVIPARRGAQVTPSVARVSAGASEHLRVAVVPNLAQFMEKAAQAGIAWIGTVTEGGEPWESVVPDPPLGWVIGSEGEGLRRLTRARCRRLVRLTGRGPVASLNASVVAGICFQAVPGRLGRAG